MIENSIIISFLLAFFQKLNIAYDQSCMAKILRSFAARFKNVLSYSCIWNFIKRPDFFSRTWEHSYIFKLCSRALNFPAWLLEKFYTRFTAMWEGSLVLRLVSAAANRLEFAVGTFLVIALAVPHKYWNNLYSTFFVLLLFVLLVIKAALQKGKGLSLSGIDFALFLFIVSVALAQVTSIFPARSFRFFLFYATCFFLILILINGIRTVKALNTVVELLLAGVSLSGLYGMYQAFAGVPMDPSLTDWTLNEGMAGRVYSTMANANNYAEILVLTLPFFVAVIINSGSYVKKGLFALMAIPPLYSLLQTGSRSSWLAFAGAILIFVFLKNRKLIPLVVILGILSYPLLPDSIHRRVMTLFTGTDTSANYRVLIYKAFAPMFKDYWFTGTGLGSDVFVKLFQKHFEYTKIQDVIAVLEQGNRSHEVEKFYQIPTTPPHTHNLYLQVWIETGLAGILAFLWFLGRTVKKCLTNIFNKTDESVNNLLIAGITGLAGVLVIGLAEYIWFYQRVMLLFWAVMGILLAGLAILAERQHKDHETI